jgi:hypothetical protein
MKTGCSRTFTSWDEGGRSGKFELFGNDGKLKQRGYSTETIYCMANLQPMPPTAKRKSVYYSNGKVTEKPSFLDKINVYLSGSGKTVQAKASQPLHLKQ